MLHDPGRALAADHAMIDRVARVALDVADAAVLQMHFDAAAAGAHVAGGVFDLVGDFRRGVDRLLGRPVIVPAFAKIHATHHPRSGPAAATAPMAASPRYPRPLPAVRCRPAALARDRTARRPGAAEPTTRSTPDRAGSSCRSGRAHRAAAASPDA